MKSLPQRFSHDSTDAVISSTLTAIKCTIRDRSNSELALFFLCLFFSKLAFLCGNVEFARSDAVILATEDTGAHDQNDFRPFLFHQE